MLLVMVALRAVPVWSSPGQPLLVMVALPAELVLWN